MRYWHPVSVRFGDCDPAGIVYYPRFLDWFHQTMEAYFGDRLDLPYATIIGQLKLGLPAAHADVDFARPCHFGEALRVGLDVTKVGSTSVHFAYVVASADDLGDIRARGSTVCVVMDLDPASPNYRRPVPVPQAWRPKLLPSSAFDGPTGP